MKQQKDARRWMIWLGWIVVIFLTGFNLVNAQSLKHVKGTRSRQLEREFTKGNLTLQYTDEGGFTLRRSSDGKWLLFPSDTSYISVNVDGNVYVQPHASDVGTALTLVSKMSTSDGPVFTYDVPDIPVRVKVAFVVQTDVMFVRTEITNRDSRNHTVAVRYLLDTQLDENDGAPLFAPGVVDPSTGQTVVTHEVTVTNPSFMIWKAFDRPDNPTFTTIGTLTQRPTQFAFAHWPEAVQAPWNYTTDPTKRFFTPGELKSPKSDSCVLIWFDSRTLRSGETVLYETAYGLHQASLPAASDRDQVVAALTRLKQTIRPAAQRWVNEASQIMAEAFVKTRPNVAKEAFKVVLSLGVGIGTSGLTPDELSALSQFGSLIRMHNVTWNVFNAIDSAVEQILEGATVYDAYSKLQPSLWRVLEPKVQQAEEALQGVITALPDPLPSSFNTKVVIEKALGASNLIRWASSGPNSLGKVPVILLPNNKRLILPEGAVYEWKKTHKKLLDSYDNLVTVSDISWATGILTSAVKIGAAASTGGLSLGGEFILTSVGVEAGILSWIVNWNKVPVRVETIINSLRANWATVADTETLRNFVVEFANWVEEMAKQGTKQHNNSSTEHRDKQFNSRLANPTTTFHRFWRNGVRRSDGNRQECGRC